MKSKKEGKVRDTLDANGEMDTMFTPEKAKKILGEKRFEELKNRSSKEGKRR